jgi:hypothetical protein
MKSSASYQKRVHLMPVFTKAVPDTHYHQIRDDFMCSLTADEYHAVEFYVSSGYKAINRYLLQVDVLDDVQVETSYQSIINNIQQAISKVTSVEPLPVLYRGTRQSFINQYQEGDEFSFSGFLSTSTDPVIAGKFAGDEEPAVLIIEGIQQGYAPISVGSYENEVIISPLSRFTVKSIVQGVSFMPEYDQSGFFAPERKNVTVMRLTAT